MAYKTKRHHIKIPLQLGDIITRLDMPGSLNERATWLIEQGIAAHPEITKKAEVNVDPVMAEISQTVQSMEDK